jgi:hypothetical protein
MSSRALHFPAGTLTHLPQAEVAAQRELTALARLEDAGVPLGVVVLPSAIEESFYRLNDLPRRLARLYQGLDPHDPDEDILEEAEGPAMRLITESYLLDDAIDAVYASLASLSGPLTVRRPGAPGEAVAGTRAALLAVKRTFRDDWAAAAVHGRLELSSRLGVDARPVIVHGADAPGAPAGAVELVIREALGAAALTSVDANGAITRVHPVDEPS